MKMPYHKMPSQCENSTNRWGGGGGGGRGGGGGGAEGF